MPGVETRFKPGQSGNPGGRPKGIARTIREIAGDDDGRLLAQFLTRAALSGFVTYVTQDGTATQEKVSMSDRLAASKVILDRGWGKPPQFAPLEDDDPLGLSARETDELAAAFDARLDELAARRRAKT